MGTSKRSRRMNELSDITNMDLVTTSTNPTLNIIANRNLQWDWTSYFGGGTTTLGPQVLPSSQCCIAHCRPCGDKYCCDCQTGGRMCCTAHVQASGNIGSALAMMPYDRCAVQVNLEPTWCKETNYTTTNGTR